MGKKQRAKKQKEEKKNKNLPFVSICTPTFNRRPFIPFTIKCFQSQDYPLDKMEWIIIDDGHDKIEDLVKDIPQVKYFKYDEKMTLGKKRNLMHEKSKGDILVYMDDDDYYPPDRVSHAVDTLQKNPKALCAGSSEIYIWFKHVKSMYQFGPYSPNHATAGTFAFKRELLKQTSYNNEASLAEEKEFLKSYSIPFVQLNPLKTILVFSHIHNTFDKKLLIENGENQFVKKSIKTVDMFIKNKEMKQFYMEDIEKELETYDAGDPKYKPDVIKQTKELKESREKMMRENQLKQIQTQQTGIQVQTSNGETKNLTVHDVKQLLEQQQNMINQLQQQGRHLLEENINLKKIVQSLKDENKTDEDNENFIQIEKTEQTEQTEQTD
jgi:hypothetical protein